ncbi:Cell envelope-associated transcriptional attenuator LytR-CpsA-Psr [Streptomyces ambofaciens ATCC 23877]|uniref:Cell envelope-associated transcriptional attenuator LytR-CpsA-Psr n=1 Tax=Streptomyces ambofaciens (strain ATCC 23877 / 3486 / DSM 40053 / JCM 4204 / NBRC 12836 / NRRL B-2516) TaxID=278992 RepID=A0A0K2AT78_STRA7|nr:Cell envelope-associated transcriptional attenuator LytR-CpsA-Psr [Streptomyces ambofaciens ATCC 23877]
MAPTKDWETVDAQGRGRAENVDPADQWVLNPRTGEYELRLSPSAPQSAVPGPRRAAPRDTDAASPADGGTAGPARRTSAPGREVPPQRRRRPAPEEPVPGRRGRRPAKKSKGKRALLWVGGSTAFVVLVAGVGGYVYLKHLEGNVSTTDVGDAGSSSFSKDEAFNILVIGTDKRTGAGNEGYGDTGSVGHADTTILLHVAKDRSNATALSIPRDLIVDIPDCETKQEDGSTEIVPGETGVRFNRSLGEGGRDAGCTMRTVKEAFGIQPNHFMMADFNAVKTLTTAVDGVDVCVEKAVDDPKSHLKLPAGESKVEGEQALAFVRTRHAFGNEGDLDRIKVQQQFLGSLMRKMSSSDTLTSPTKLVKLAEAATKALTVDSAIGKVGTLKDMALELKKVPTKNITFATVPVKDNPAEKVKATVVVDEAKAPQVFDMIRNDISFTEVKKKEKKEKAAVAARLEGEKSDPSEIRVRVLNGGAAAGSAQQELNYLQTEAGVTKSENAGNADTELAKTTLEYAPDQADQARALAEILGLSGAAMKPGESVTNAQGLPTMTLTLGKDFKGAGVKLDATSVKTPELDKSTADQVQCAS